MLGIKSEVEEPRPETYRVCTTWLSKSRLLNYLQYQCITELRSTGGLVSIAGPNEHNVNKVSRRHSSPMSSSAVRENIYPCSDDDSVRNVRPSLKDEVTKKQER